MRLFPFVLVMLVAQACSPPSAEPRRPVPFSTTPSPPLVGDAAVVIAEAQGLPLLFERGNDIAEGASGSLIVGGDPYRDLETANRAFGVAKFRADGTVATSFATSGLALEFLDFRSAEVRDVIVTEGHIFACGAVWDEHRSYLALAQFDEQSGATSGARAVIRDSWSCNALAEVDTGTVVIAGDTPAGFTLWKLSVEQGTTGEIQEWITIPRRDPDGGCCAGDLAVESSGAVLLSVNTYGYFVRVLPSGEVDRSMGENGYVPFGGTLQAIAAADGGIVAAGCTSDGPLIRRYRADGSLDPAFGDDGSLAFPGQGCILDIDPTDGGHLLAGYDVAGGLVLKITPSGLDESFGVRQYAIEDATRFFAVEALRDGSIGLSGFDPVAVRIVP